MLDGCVMWVGLGDGWAGTCLQVFHNRTRHPIPPHLTSHTQDVHNRISQDMQAYAKAVPPTTRMLCLHGSADTAIPYQARGGGAGWMCWKGEQAGMRAAASQSRLVSQLPALCPSAPPSRTGVRGVCGGGAQRAVPAGGGGRPQLQRAGAGGNPGSPRRRLCAQLAGWPHRGGCPWCWWQARRVVPVAGCPSSASPVPSARPQLHQPGAVPLPLLLFMVSCNCALYPELNNHHQLSSPPIPTERYNLSQSVHTSTTNELVDWLTAEKRAGRGVASSLPLERGAEGLKTGGEGSGGEAARAAPPRRGGAAPQVAGGDINTGACP